MEDRFLIELQKMVAHKSDSYQLEFFKRIHEINRYKNRIGCVFGSLNAAAIVAQQLDNEQGEFK
jgi:hypothetical protein